MKILLKNEKLNGRKINLSKFNFYDKEVSTLFRGILFGWFSFYFHVKYEYLISGPNIYIFFVLRQELNESKNKNKVKNLFH